MDDACWRRNLVEMLSSFQKTGYLCDMDIVSKDGALFAVHSCVVAATSSVLEAAITLWISKSGNGPGFNRLAVETNIPGDVLPSLICSMYTGHISVEEERLDEMRRALTKLGVKNASKRSKNVNTSTKFASWSAKENSNNAYFLVQDGSQALSDDDDDNEDETGSQDSETTDIEDTEVDNSQLTFEEDKVLESIKLEPESSCSPSHFLRSRKGRRTASASGSGDRKELLGEQLTSRTLLHHRETHDIFDKDANTAKDEIKEEILEETESLVIANNSDDMVEETKEQLHFPFSRRKSSTLSSQKQRVKESKSPGVKGKADMQSQRFKCASCQKAFRDKHDLTRHVKTVHQKLRPYYCQDCAKTFKERSALNRHYSKCHGLQSRPFTQKQVVKEDPNVAIKKSLEARKVLDSSAEDTFLCRLCGEAFQRFARFERHLLKRHDDIRPYACNLCSKTYRSKASFGDHVATHKQGINYYCDQCAKGFSFRSTFWKHKATVHTDVKPFNCPKCDKSFKLRDQLKVHDKSKHQNIRNYLCSYCPKSFSTRSCLNSHEKIHTGFGRIQCPKCTQTFVQSGTFKIHMRYHTGDRPYQCRFCPSAYTSSNMRKQHERKHHENNNVK